MNLATKKGNRAQGMIEFAIILPVLLLMLMVIFDVGRSIYTYSVIHNAAREAARYGIIHPTDTTGATQTALHLTSGLDSTGIAVSFPTAVPGTFEVEVRYTFSAATPLLGQLLGNSTNQIELVGHSIMYIEN
jgi:Flp pilus assembly protein TadG